MVDFNHDFDYDGINDFELNQQFYNTEFVDPQLLAADPSSDFLPPFGGPNIPQWLNNIPAGSPDSHQEFQQNQLPQTGASEKQTGLELPNEQQDLHLNQLLLTGTPQNQAGLDQPQDLHLNQLPQTAIPNNQAGLGVLNDQQVPCLDQLQVLQAVTPENQSGTRAIEQHQGLAIHQPQAGAPQLLQTGTPNNQSDLEQQGHHINQFPARVLNKTSTGVTEQYQDHHLNHQTSVLGGQSGFDIPPGNVPAEVGPGDIKETFTDLEFNIPNLPNLLDNHFKFPQPTMGTPFGKTDGRDGSPSAIDYPSPYDSAEPANQPAFGTENVVTPTTNPGGNNMNIQHGLQHPVHRGPGMVNQGSYQNPGGPYFHSGPHPFNSSPGTFHGIGYGMMGNYQHGPQPLTELPPSMPGFSPHASMHMPHPSARMNVNNLVSPSPVQQNPLSGFPPDTPASAPAPSSRSQSEEPSAPVNYPHPDDYEGRSRYVDNTDAEKLEIHVLKKIVIPDDATPARRARLEALNKKFEEAKKFRTRAKNNKAAKRSRDNKHNRITNAEAEKEMLSNANKALLAQNRQLQAENVGLARWIEKRYGSDALAGAYAEIRRTVHVALVGGQGGLDTSDQQMFASQPRDNDDKFPAVKDE